MHDYASETVGGRFVVAKQIQEIDAKHGKRFWAALRERVRLVSSRKTTSNRQWHWFSTPEC